MTRKPLESGLKGLNLTNKSVDDFNYKCNLFDIFDIISLDNRGVPDNFYEPERGP